MSPEEGSGAPVVSELPNLSGVQPGVAYYLSSDGHIYAANKVIPQWELASSSSSGLIFESVTATTKESLTGHYYLANNDSDRIGFALPTVCNPPDTVVYSGLGSAGYRITLGPGQIVYRGDGLILYGNNNDYIDTIDSGAVIKLTCIERDLKFKIDYVYLNFNDSLP